MRSNQLSAVLVVLMLSAGLDTVSSQEEAASSVSLPEGDTPCVDNPLYRSRTGLTCSQHANMDCKGLQSVAFTHDQIEVLLRECPVSCRAPRCVGKNQDDSREDTAVSTKATAAAHPASLTLGISTNRVLQAAVSDPGACYPGWDPTCQDDATYSRFGASCSSFAGLDCSFFRFAGWRQSEVEQLMLSCPCSCRAECKQPTASPTFIRMTDLPTITPSDSYSSSPSISASSGPSGAPSKASESPRSVPTITLSSLPSNIPTVSPSITASDVPSLVDSAAPTSLPSNLPTVSKSQVPSTSPTLLVHHSSSPSSYPSAEPTVRHSQRPSSKPSTIPTSTPSAPPSDSPSTPMPSEYPTFEHSEMPSAVPSIFPTTQQLGINPPITDRISQGQAQDSSSTSSEGNGSIIAISVGCACAGLVALLIGYAIHKKRRKDHSPTGRTSDKVSSSRSSTANKSASAATIIASCQRKASSTSEAKRQREERKASAAPQTPADQRAAWKRSMFVEPHISLEEDGESVEAELTPIEEGTTWDQDRFIETQCRGKADEVSVAASETAEATQAAAEPEPAQERTALVKEAEFPTIREQDEVSVASSVTAENILQELDALTRSIASSRSSRSRATGVTSRSRTTGNRADCTVSPEGLLERCFCFDQEPYVDNLYDVRSGGSNTLTLGEKRSDSDEYDYDDEGRDDISEFEEIRREGKERRMQMEKARQRRKRTEAGMPLDVVAFPSPRIDSALGNCHDEGGNDSGIAPLDNDVMMLKTISGLTTLND